MANNLKKLRERAGISKKQLAGKVGTSPLQLQRIESNRCPAPLKLAMRLSAALDTPINRVFPGAAKALAALDDELAQPMHVSRETHAKLRDVGLEGDPRQHTLKVLLRGHQEPMFFQILANEEDRIFSAVQDESHGATGLSFIVFNTNELRVAINLKALMFCHFLWEAGFVIISSTAEVNEGEEDDEDGPGEAVQVYFGENSTPTVIGAEAENGDDIENENNYINSIFNLLDTGMEAHKRLHIVDEDGESAFLRVGDISLLTAPLWVLDPDERIDEDDDEENGDDGGAQLPSPL